MSKNDDIKKLNKLLVNTNKINIQLLQASDKKKLCQQICNYFVKIKDYKFVWMGLKETENDKFTPIALSGKDKVFIELIKDSWNRYGFNGCSTSIALKGGSHYIICTI
jgi:hypothetical protein